MMKKPSLALSRLLQVLVWGYVFVVLIFVAFSFSSLYQVSRTTLWADQWILYHSYFFQDFPESILTSRGPHRTVFPALIRLADIYFARANNTLLLVFAGSLNILTACLISWFIWRERELDKPIRMLCISLVWMLLFWLANLRVLGHDPNVTYALVVFPFTGALWAVFQAEEARRQARPNQAAMALLVVGLGCFVSTFSLGFGLVIWPVIFFVAALLRVPVKTLGLIGIFFVVAMVLYFFILPIGGTLAGSSQYQPVQLLIETSAFIGAPAFHISYGLEWIKKPQEMKVLCALLGGSAMLAVSLVCLKRLFTAERIAFLETWSLATSVFGIGCALLVAIGRGGFETPQWPAPRYLPWACFFWIGFLVLLGLYAARQTRPGFQRAWLAVVFLLPVLLFPAHIRASLSSRIAKYRTQEVALGLVVGVQDDERVKRLLYGNPAVVHRLAKVLQSEHLAMFSWDVARYIGQQMDQEFTVVEANDIKGGVREVTVFPDGDQLGARFSGSVLDPQDSHPPQDIVVADSRGQIQGLGQFVPKRKGLTKLLSPDDRPGLFFGGYIKNYTEDEEYNFFAILADGRSVVRLRSPRRRVAHP